MWLKPHACALELFTLSAGFAQKPRSRVRFMNSFHFHIPVYINSLDKDCDVLHLSQLISILSNKKVKSIDKVPLSLLICNNNVLFFFSVSYFYLYFMLTEVLTGQTVAFRQTLNFSKQHKHYNQLISCNQQWNIIVKNRNKLTQVPGEESHSTVIILSVYYSLRLTHNTRTLSTGSADQMILPLPLLINI